MGELDLAAIDLLVIENVGNLVCTAGFDLGERLRIIVLSTSEGDDKARKISGYFPRIRRPVYHQDGPVAVLNFDAARITADMKRLAPEAPVFQVSAP